MKQYTPAGEILKKEYLNWLKENGVESVDSAKSYLTPLNIKYPGSEDTYFDVIAYYAAKGLPVELGKVMRNLEEKYNNSGNDNYNSYIRKFRSFVYLYVYSNRNNIFKTEIPQKSYKSVRRKTYRLDGMLEFLSSVDIKELSEIALKSSYFFSNELIDSRVEKLSQMIADGQAVPVRNAPNRGGNVSFNGINCMGDADGNKSVREMIKEDTGYVLSGESRHFDHYIISHLWGDAESPFMFTNYANLALIPAWINHLLDKGDCSDSLTGEKVEKLKATILKVAEKLYSLNNIPAQWNAPSKNMSAKSINGAYVVNIINPKDSDEDYGRIIQKTIKI